MNVRCAILAAALVAGCTSKPEPGSSYALSPDPWCEDGRLMVLEVKDDYVLVVQELGRDKKLLQRTLPISYFYSWRAIYEPDPYNCWDKKQ